jgi:two-component system, NtrC family, response regulator GlrR
MKPAILLLDLNPADALCESLRTVLDESFRSDFTLQLRGVASNDPASIEDSARTVSQLKASIVLMVLPSDLATKALTLLDSVRRYSPEVPVIAVVDASEPALMLQLLRHGASDFITPPLKAIDVVPRVCRLLEQVREQGGPVHALKQTLGLKRLVGESPAFVAEISKFPIIARCDASVLILGETGTGKELCARAIHYVSPRAAKPFVPVNCGAIPVELVENELFGHEREAFTGAASSRSGLIHEADGGTLFMDEIDCLPLLAQVKLLRFLQDKEYRPLGSMKMRQADVRVMAATNIDLEEAVRAGKLRPDLYYRLNVIPLVLPPLRERREDIPLLARHFLARYADEFDKVITDFSLTAMQMLLLYEWPGNVRELEHVIERAIVMCERKVIGSEDIQLPRLKPGASEASFQEMKATMIAQFERTYINGLLRAHRGNISKAARAARKDPRALRQLIRKHKIDVRVFKESA